MTQQEFFDRYSYDVAVDRIGGGGFGTVYKAYDNLLHRDVAIKVSEVKTTADGKKSFSLKDEFEALSHVPKHRNIANYEEFYSFKTQQGIFDYAVMQYYLDGNLTQAIKEGLSDEQKDEIATQLLEGIDFLHRHKVVHRDLKPGNILITRHGGHVIPLITDFGLSKAADTGDGSVFTNSFGGGTPRYSSPEQLQGKPLRFNTDLWSYGAIVYELFTGEQLFTPGSGASNSAQAELEVYNKIVQGDVQSLAKMPERWRKVAERCMVVDPEKRVKTAEELLFLLNGYAEATEVEGVVVPQEQQPQVQTQQKPQNPSQPQPVKPVDKPADSKPVNHKPELPKVDKSSNAKKRGKGLWIGLAAVAVIALALVLLWKPKEEMPVPVDPDTEAFLACQTVNDYRQYIIGYGHYAKHYHEADSLVRQYEADSLAEVQALLAQQQAQQVQQTTNPSANSSLSSSQPFTVNGVTFVMKRVEGGTFQMGATSEQGSDAYDDESPVHSVTLSTYFIGETEVTQALWKAVMGSNPSNWKGDNLPVESVSWNDCQNFISELNRLTGENFRLPTEAEWEYAARGGKKSNGCKYSGSHGIDNVAWYNGNSGSKTHPVKSKNPNELGLYDMSGNVYEWCSDWKGTYSSSSQTNPKGPSSGSYRVLRGGGWSSDATICRVSYRNAGDQVIRSGNRGFRLALPQ